jgi:beta-glucuronidase
MFRSVVRTSGVVLALVGTFGVVETMSAQDAARGMGSTPGDGRPSVVLADFDHRQQLSLNGDWHIIADPYVAGLLDFHMHVNPNGYFNDQVAEPGSNALVEYSFAKSPTIKVPGDWNMQREDLKLYEGPLWYERKFDYTPESGHRAWLHIGAANYRSRMFVNGKLACEHEGGFTTFDCEVTDYVKPGVNDAVIYVDDTRLADGIPTLKTDWYNYGGLTRDVSIITTPKAFIDDFDLHLDRATRSVIEGYVHVEGAAEGTKVSVAIPEAKLSFAGTADASGRVAVSMPAKGLSLWAPGNPKLYRVSLKAGGDAIEDEMGFRTIEVRGSKIVLNGKPIVLHGICIHAEAPYRSGRVNTDADVATLFGWARDLGVNFVRLAHYPHDVRMERAADKLGILVWSEVPVYWAVHFDDEAVFRKSQKQLKEEIARDRDKASVILWSIANETPNTEARTAFLSRSAAYVKELDPTRLVTAALLVRSEGDTMIIDDKLGTALDVIGFNEYIGWYGGTPESMDKKTWKVAYDKPLIVSEFGGDAKAGLHGSEHERWTEEYQANIYHHAIAMLNRIPQLRGSTPWILMDFRSPVRQMPGLQDGFNRKGLVSDQGEKKLAFGVLEKAYKGDGLGKAE